MIYFNYKVEYVSEKAIQLNDVFVSGDCVVLGDHEYEKIDKHDCVFLQRKRNFDRSAMPNAVFGIRLSEDEKNLIEEENYSLSAFEMKAGKKNPKAPKAFADAYPDATFNIVNKDNFWEFVV